MFMQGAGKLDKRLLMNDTMAVLAGSRYDENGLEKWQRVLEQK